MFRSVSIRRLDESDHERSLEIVREAFATVARDFALTEQNAPTTPAFLTSTRFRETAARSVVMFGVFVENQQVGFVAVERGDAGAFYIERLAVLPAYRHRGIGAELIEHVRRFALEHGGTSIDAAIMDSHEVLKTWYLSLGFEIIGTKSYRHLPFVVCFLRKK